MWRTGVARVVGGWLVDCKREKQTHDETNAKPKDEDGGKMVKPSGQV